MTCAAYDQFAASEHHIASMVHVANERMTALQQLVETQHRSMLHEYEELASSINEINAMTQLLPIAVERVSDFTNSLVQLTELKSALLHALNGRLDTFLIHHMHMASAMHRIRTELRSIHCKKRKRFETFQNIVNVSLNYMLLYTCCTQTHAL